MRKRSTGVVVAFAGLLLTVAPPSGAQVGAGSAVRSSVKDRSQAAALPQSKSWKVTLLTGDVVQVSTTSGHPPRVLVKPGPGRDRVQFLKEILPNGDVRVIPLDVAPKIGKVYDPALFNVTTLIREGDDDAKSSSLPLIVQGGGGALRPALSGRALTSLNATATHEAKAKGPQLAQSVAAGGVRHVWLDRKVHATALDHNLTQIGAPAAWHASATGKGVKVAVLDTGVDATHPDLKGRIAEQKNFSQSPDTADRFGHGTHVAATIAGTGVASSGERRGVAFDADLVIGKVLGDDGSGEESDIIAGMEWAATQARIVSMSLGGSADDPTNDPATQAVEDLTAKYNTLFVVAAGNDGPFANTVSVPALAPSALAVGAVDGQDHVADFSSRGGTIMKPEISAPGVDIIQARATGTAIGDVIDADYTSLSGTSMATPQVSGAAADLLQEHPDWSAARLKAALTSTSDAVSDTVYNVGAGRLNVGAATAATVIGDAATLAFGTVPHGATAPIVKKVSWTNTGTRPVTLHLDAQLADPAKQVHAKALTVPSTVIVPAGGSAGVDVSLDPTKLTTGGLYSGAVTASGSGVSLRTAVGVSAEPETHTLTVKTTALPDTPADASSALIEAVDLDNPDLFTDFADVDGDGIARFPVPSGRYAVFGVISDTTTDHERAALTGNPSLTVTGDTTLNLDASHAHPLQMSGPGVKLDPTQVAGIDLDVNVGDNVLSEELFNFSGRSPAGSRSLYTTNIGGGPANTFHAFVTGRLSDDSGQTVYDVLHNLGGKLPAEVNYQVDPTQFARIDERFGALDGDVKDADGEKKLGLTPNGVVLAEDDDLTLPAASTRTTFVSAEPGIMWAPEAFLPVTQEGIATILPFRQFTPQSRQSLDWGRQPFRPGPYSATGLSASLCEPGPSIRRSGNIHIAMVDLQIAPEEFDCLDALNDDWRTGSSRTMTLYSGDTLLGGTHTAVSDFSVPATAGTYRLHYDVDASQVVTVSTKTSTDWTFHSRPDELRLPLLTVDYHLPLDLHNHPNGDTATFTVSRVAGAAKAKPTGLKLWTSLDDGATWQPAVVAASGGSFSARLPHAGKGQFVSLRVSATDAGGSGIDQTIIRAYAGA